MSFVDTFNALPMDALLARASDATEADVAQCLARGPRDLADFATLISPAAGGALETMCAQSQQLTRQRFGRVIRLFAPLYLSNECVNNCSYCGFSRDNPILRVTLSVEEVESEALELKRQGFRNLLLVAGEHPKFVSNGYLEECIRRLHADTPGISLELGPMETDEYEPLARAGAEGLVVYQETYDREVYAEVHTAGPKKKFDWRLETPERAYEAGFKRLGIGALFGLAEWQREAIAVAAHADYLLRNCWKSQLTVSLPRLRPCAGQYEPKHGIDDRQLTRLICALRLFLPDVGIVLSTREAPQLRDGLIPLGITMISAGSHTEPGGYTGAGADNLHLTERGRIVELAEDSSEWSGARSATGQFDIADERSPAEMAETLQRMGYEPVWKDWDAALTV